LLGKEDVARTFKPASANLGFYPAFALKCTEDQRARNLKPVSKPADPECCLVQIVFDYSFQGLGCRAAGWFGGCGIGTFRLSCQGSDVEAGACT
jgi:hypothetical protein